MYLQHVLSVVESLICREKLTQQLKEPVSVSTLTAVSCWRAMSTVTVSLPCTALLSTAANLASSSAQGGRSDGKG